MKPSILSILLIAQLDHVWPQKRSLIKGVQLGRCSVVNLDFRRDSSWVRIECFNSSSMWGAAYSKLAVDYESCRFILKHSFTPILP
ncbi:hypothetical protein P3J6_90060 [Pseudoalteromonas sp. 3J6]|nr:hypothetical protein P3J6_90060 [Pseudoalteromonas sp. 3J6]